MTSASLEDRGDDYAHILTNIPKHGIFLHKNLHLPISILSKLKVHRKSAAAKNVTEEIENT